MHIHLASFYVVAGALIREVQCMSDGYYINCYIKYVSCVTIHNTFVLINWRIAKLFYESQ